MQRQNVRVILASEHPEIRNFLQETVKQEGAVVVGQADNAARTLALARNLRPDVAILDCHLPHTVGLNAVRLSRAGGLDTAQSLSTEIPHMQVVLLGNLDTATTATGEVVVPEQSIASFLRDTGGTYAPFTLKDLVSETAKAPVFANIEVKRRVPYRQKILRLGDQVILCGTLGVLGGLVLLLSGILAVPGVVVAGVGLMAVLLGLFWKLVLRYITENS